MAQQVNPHLKIVIDGLWLVYSGAKLHDSWKREGRDTSLCFLKAVRLFFNTVFLFAGFYIQINIPLSSGKINFILKWAEARRQGKNIPFKELLLSIDQQLTLPLNLLKAAGFVFNRHVSLTRLYTFCTCKK